MVSMLQIGCAGVRRMYHLTVTACDTCVLIRKYHLIEHLIRCMLAYVHKPGVDSTQTQRLGMPHTSLIAGEELLSDSYGPC